MGGANAVGPVSVVALEGFILGNHQELLVNRVVEILSLEKHRPRTLNVHRAVRIPPEATRAGVSGDVYDAYRLGLASACADVVLVMEVDGEPRVPLIRRARPPFGGCWWIMGGVIFNFRPVQQFLAWKVYRECGLEDLSLDEFVQAHNLADDQYSCGDVEIIGCLGVCRTAAEDTVGKVCDTVNLCYMAIYRGTQELHHDKDHTSVRWVGEKDLQPGFCGHWYPEWAATRAIEIYRSAQLR